MRIMITGSAGPAGRALTRLLATTDHHVIGVDMAPEPSPALEAIAAVPAASDPAMLPELARLVDLHRVDLLIPTVSDELPQVAAAAGLLLRPARTQIGSLEAVTLCHDKYLTMVALEAAGVPVPRFGLPSHYPDAAAALRALGGPLVIKPRVGRGGRGVRVLEEAGGVDWSTLDDSLILQEFAPGTEYAPMVHRSPRADAPTQVVVLEKTELANGRVGNAVSVRRLPPGGARDVAAVADHAITALDLRGPVDLDVRRTRAGRPVVLEVNARFGANSEQAPEILQAVLAEQQIHLAALAH